MKGKKLAKRSLALFLALVMCIGMLQTTAFATTAEDFGVTIPDDATTTTTPTENGSITETTWESGPTTDGPDTTNGDPSYSGGDDAEDAFNDLVSGNIDDVEKGPYTETVTDTTTSTTTEVEGSQTETNSTTQNGNTVTESSTLEGSQTTTTTTETTTTTTETTAEKTEQSSEETGIEVSGDIFTEEYVPEDEEKQEATVKKGESDSYGGTIEGDIDTDELMKALDGWTVESDGKSYTIHVDEETGKVSYTDENGNDANLEMHLDNEGNLSFRAKQQESYTVDFNADDFDWTAPEGYVSNGDPVDNGDGSYTQTYINPEDGSTYEITVEANGTVTVTRYVDIEASFGGGSYGVEFEWADTEVGADHGSTRIVQVLGPSGEVIGYAVENRKNGTTTHRLLFTNQKVAESAGSGTNGEFSDGWYLSEGAKGDIIQSTVLVDGSYAWLRRMTDGNGNYFYVYCVEHGKGIEADAEYDIANTEDHGIYGENGAQIQYVAEKGWWGTNSGPGSLDEVKQLIPEELWQYLDEGMALAATQAALWYFTSPDAIRPSADSFLKEWVSNGKGDFKEANLGDNEKAALAALFNALTGGAEQFAKDVEEGKASLTTTDLITEDDIVSTSIQVVEKADVESLAELNELVKKSVADGTEDDLYVTNVSVTLAVLPSRINGDVTVYIYCDGVCVGSERVNAETMDANGKITISNVLLRSGGNITFNLRGVQELTEGAYLFTTDVSTDASGNKSTSSQTMIGYVDGNVGGKVTERKVDLVMDVNFTVNEERNSNSAGVTGGQTVTVATVVTERTTVETERETVRWDENDVRTYTIPDDGDDDYNYGDDDDDDDDITTIIEEQTPLADASASENAEDEEFIDIDDQVPLAPAEAEEEELMEIEDEVPLAGVPQTGDESGIWSYVMMLSAAGMICLAVIERKKSQEED